MQDEEEGFRGKLASASLKLIGGRFAPCGGKEIPRQACLGLIEAFPTRYSTVDTVLRFRGKLASASLKRPRNSRMRICRRRFRGKLASASLKRLECFFTIKQDGGFRGKLASASLKPRHHRKHERPRLSAFRGKLASASLKPVVRATPQLPGYRFRGKLASASLKRKLSRTFFSHSGVIPRQACLGLIEAFILALLCYPKCPDSEASLPRPH